MVHSLARQNSVQAAVLEYSSQFTKIASPAVDAVTQNPLLELRSLLNVIIETPFGVHSILSGSCFNEATISQSTDAQRLGQDS